MNMQAPPPQNIQLPGSMRNVGENIGNAVEQAKTGFNNAISGFSNQAEAGITSASSSTQSFLQSNTIIAKFAFLILIIIAFIILLTLGINLLHYFLAPAANPYLIYGSAAGNSNQIISTDPKQKNSVQISRSNNQSKGLEFTWSTWLYINDLGPIATATAASGSTPAVPAKPSYQHIFNKGNTTFTGSDSTTGTTGLATVNNGPGLYLAPSDYTSGSNASVKISEYNPNKATLHVVMNTSSGSDNSNVVDIDNIPLKKWVHVALRMENTIMDIYINGIVSNRLVMSQVPKQNYNDVNVGMNGGFNGQISNLRYYQYALNAFEINSIVYAGPNTNNYSAPKAASYGYTYLSNNWYSSKY